LEVLRRYAEILKLRMPMKEVSLFRFPHNLFLNYSILLGSLKIVFVIYFPEILFDSYLIYLIIFNYFIFCMILVFMQFAHI